MSTRAIIALPTPKGFITAWCWNDGDPKHLGRELRKYFREENTIRRLLSLRSFNSIWGPRTIKQVMQKEDDDVVLINSRCVLIGPHGGKVIAGRGKHAFFKSLNEMLGQDRDYVYVFKDGKWTTYK